jgi:beta,beta-carotene 9',10'-dioxygenase
MTTTSLRASIDTARVSTQRELASAAATLANRVPFRGPASPRGSERARLHGRLPEWLRGDLVRVAPCIGATPNWAPAHWFDALGLVFGFAVTADRVDVRWSLLEGEVGAAAEGGKVPLAQFASPNQRGPVTRLMQPIPKQTDNTNVNVVRMGDQWVALTETPTQYALDPKTLRVRSRVEYPRDAIGHAGMLAHPISQGDTLTNLAVAFGARGKVTLFDQRGNSRVRSVRGSWSAAELPYIHSFGLSDKTAIIVDHPLRIKPYQLLWSNRGVIEHFRWDPKSPARLVLIDRADGRVHSHETEPLFCFHTVHAFETATETVLDLIAYDDAQIISALSVPHLVDYYPTTPSRLLRLSVNRQSGRVSRHVLCELPFEFPQVDWEHVGAAPEQVVFGTRLRSEGARLQGTILRVELASGEVRSFSEPGYTFGEALFIGKPGRRKEAEGVLLAVGAAEHGSALFVIDASSLETIAHAEVDAYLPLGFHGNFAPD